MSTVSMESGIGVGVILLLGILMVVIIKHKIKIANNEDSTNAITINTRSLIPDTIHRIFVVLGHTFGIMIGFIVFLGIAGGIVGLFVMLLTSGMPEPPQQNSTQKSSETDTIRKDITKEDPVITSSDIGKVDSIDYSAQSQKLANHILSLASEGYYTNDTWHTYARFHASNHEITLQRHNQLYYIHNVKAYMGKYGGIIIKGNQNTSTSNTKPVSILIIFNRNNDKGAINVNGDHTKLGSYKHINGYSESQASKYASSHLISDPQYTLKYTPQS